MVDCRKISNFAQETSKLTNEDCKMWLTITLMGVEHKIRPLIGPLINLIELINYRGKISNFAQEWPKVAIMALKCS